MGLSGRKEKQRIGLDPRNLTWSDDKSRFSYQHMKNLGWKDATGIGRDLDGNPNHIAVVKRMDNSGIGAGKKEGGTDSAGQSFEEVLKRLTGSASASPAPEPASASVEVVSTETKLSGRVASRNKHRQSKKMIASSPAALAEILGVSVASLSPSSTPLSPSPLATPTPGTPTAIDAPDVKSKEEESTDISTSTLSVSDYFRAKMKERAKLRANPPPTPVMEEVIVQQTVQFSEPVVVESSGPSTPADSLESPRQTVEDKATKKARKEAKAKRKAEKAALVEETSSVAAAPVEAPAAAEPVEEAPLPSKEEARAAKRARKEEKEARREAKRQKKASKE